MRLDGPAPRGGTWSWRGSWGEVEVRFTGQGPREERDEVLRRIEGGSEGRKDEKGGGRIAEVEGGTGGRPAVAWLKQIHSNVALAALAGPCGEGDGIFTSAAGLALAVATADCVPVLVATGDGRIAAIHAGWRGLANGVIGATLRAMAEGGEVAGGGLRAWIGPAIGPCCYEVGDEVAEAVIAASGPEVASSGPGGKPHLDLAAAARIQLSRLGLGEGQPTGISDPCNFDQTGVEGPRFGRINLQTVPHCTRCESERLWSYRRLGKGAGRNLAFIWRR